MVDCPFFEREIIRKSFVLFSNPTFIEIFYFNQISRHFNAMNAKKSDLQSVFHLFLFRRRSIEHAPNIRNGLRKMNNEASKEKMLPDKQE